MKKFLHTLFCLLLTGCMFAQMPFYEQGYLISNDGDTIKGYVERLRDVKLAEQLRFLEDPDGTTPAVYKPFSIKGFGLSAGDLYFESVMFHSQKGVQKDSMPCFAKQMLTGHASLFYLQFPPEASSLFDTKSYKSDYVYILKMGEQYYTLDEVLIYSTEEKKNFVLPRYKGTLRYAFRDCPQLAKELERLSYQREKILKSVVNYNKCIDPTAPLKLRGYTPKSKWTVGVEASLATILKDEEKRDGFGWSIGANAWRFNAGENEKSKVTVGINFLSVNYKDPLGNLKVFNTVRLPIIVFYYLGQQTNKPYLSAGLTASDKFFFMNLGTGIEFSSHSFAQIFIETNPLKWDSPMIASLKLGYHL